MQIALVLYPKFTVLDIIGPFQALVDVPGHEVVFVAEEAGPVVDHTGQCPLVARASLSEVSSPDVVVVPGGTSREFEGPVSEWLRDVYPSATWITSVCTGSIFLAAAGLLDGLDAATHWAWTAHLAVSIGLPPPKLTTQSARCTSMTRASCATDSDGTC